MVLKWPFVSDTGEDTLHDHCPGLLRDRALQVSGPSWNGRPVGGDSWGENWLHFQPSGTELFYAADLDLGAGLEMAWHLIVTLGRNSSQSQLIHIMVLKYVFVCHLTVCIIQGQLYNCTRNGLERKKHMLHIMILKCMFLYAIWNFKKYLSYRGNPNYKKMVLKERK